MQDDGEELLLQCLPRVYTFHAEGHLANHCIDATHTLMYAYRQLGVESEILPVDLAIKRMSDGAMLYHGTPEPRWDEKGQYTSHAVLHLTERHSLIDVTVEQYPAIAALGMGPVIGRGRVANQPLLPGQSLPPGSAMALQRKDLLIVYTVADPDHMQVVRADERIINAQESYRRFGNTCAVTMLNLLRMPDVKDRRHLLPDRTQAFLRAIGDAKPNEDDRHEFGYDLPDAYGQLRRTTLDEILKGK
jgi:hypothetical protein